MGERPWIEWSSGPCPVPRGTLVDTWHRDGTIELKVKALCHLYHGRKLVSTEHKGRGSNWRWDGPIRARDIIAYRLSDTDDKAKREARMEIFRGIAKSKEFLIEETLKPREKVK